MYIVLLGAPGTGKGTQAALLAKRLGLSHIATGDMLREAVQQGSELGKRAKAYMDEGQLVPDEVTIRMLRERIQRPDSADGAVLDGFPRTLPQAVALDRMLEELGSAVTAAVLLAVPDEELIRRLTGRWLCPNCGEIYHEGRRPPTKGGLCDSCGGALLQREDDKPDVVRERLKIQRPPADMLDHYKGRGRLREVDGQQPPEKVTRGILDALGINSDVKVATH